MTPCEQFGLAGVLELAETVGACGVEKPVVHDRVADIRGDKRLCHEVRDVIVDVPGVDIGTCRDRLGSIQREAAGENGQTTQHHTLGFGKELIAPVERRAQRPVPRQGRAPAARQDPETIVQERRQSPHAESIDAARPSSIASAMPSSRRQMSATAGASASVSSNVSRLSVARSTKS
jgi:hypothetical protein